MGTFILGRVGLEGPSTGEVDGWSESGNRVQVSGHTSYGSVEESLVLRAQFMGLVDSPDEAFVPMVWSEQPEVDGYYRVLDVRFGSSVDRAPFGVLDWEAELERVQGFAAPLMELRTLGKLRANVHSFTAASQAICVPDASESVAFLNEATGAFVSPGSGAVRSSASGGVLVFSRDPGTRYLTQFYVPPSDHYAGAATLYAGESAATVVGRQVRNTPDLWVLSNGLLEVAAVAGPDFDVRFRMWSGGVWKGWTSFTFTIASGTQVALQAPHTVTVLRNRPEEVAVRLLTAGTVAGTRYPVTVDLSLKRGSRFVSVDVQAGSPVVAEIFGVRCAAFVSPSTPHASYRTKALGDGTTMVVASPHALTVIGSDFSPTAAGNSRWPFALGLTDGTASTVRDEYMFAASDKQAVVAQ